VLLEPRGERSRAEPQHVRAEPEAGKLAGTPATQHRRRGNAEQFGDLAVVSSGDPAPVTGIAKSHQVTPSAASRWVKTARERRMIEEASDGS
jgi:hypothetical protein